MQVVIGSLYLQAGRWADAIKELVDGATVARSVNDHLWHGKALELIFISLLLLGWADVEFAIPSILFAPQEKGSNATAAAMQEAENKDPKQPRWMRHLQVLIPDLVDRILGLYSRISAEHLPLTSVRGDHSIFQDFDGATCCGGAAGEEVSRHDSIRHAARGYPNHVAAVRNHPDPVSNSQHALQSLPYIRLGAPHDC